MVDGLVHVSWDVSGSRPIALVGGTTHWHLVMVLETMRRLQTRGATEHKCNLTTDCQRNGSWRVYARRGVEFTRPCSVHYQEQLNGAVSAFRKTSSVQLHKRGLSVQSFHGVH
eukprot:4581375-Amphidinium_carterae.1